MNERDIRKILYYLAGVMVLLALVSFMVPCRDF